MRNLLRNYLPICLIISLFACTSNNQTKVSTKNIVQKSSKIIDSNEWIFQGTAGSILKFKNGKEYNTNLYELNYIGQIVNGHEAPFLVFSGRDCNECDANISIYVYSPSNRPLKVENGENRYQYPGTERDYESDSLLYKARAFYGQVLPGINGVIWYNEQLIENNTWQKSLFLVNLSNGIKKDTALKISGQLKNTLRLLDQGACKEIKGLDYKSEP